MNGKDGLKVCKSGGGCFYYEGVAGPCAGLPLKHLCACNTPYGFDGYHFHDLKIEDLEKCPVGKW